MFGQWLPGIYRRSLDRFQQSEPLDGWFASIRHTAAKAVCSPDRRCLVRSRLQCSSMGSKLDRLRGQAAVLHVSTPPLYS
jgi:hypothetical protein